MYKHTRSNSQNKDSYLNVFLMSKNDVYRVSPLFVSLLKLRAEFD